MNEETKAQREASNCWIQDFNSSDLFLCIRLLSFLNSALPAWCSPFLRVSASWLLSPFNPPSLSVTIWGGALYLSSPISPPHFLPSQDSVSFIMHISICNYMFIVYFFIVQLKGWQTFSLKGQIIDIFDALSCLIFTGDGQFSYSRKWA